MKTVGRIGNFTVMCVLAFVVSYWFIKTSFFVRPWEPPEEAIAYVWEGPNGQEMTVMFSTSHNVLMWYSDAQHGFEDEVLMDVAGSAGTKLIGRLWYVRGPAGWAEHTIAPSGTRPLLAETSVLARDSTSLNQHFFPPVGTRDYHYFYFGDTFLLFQNRKLLEQPINEAKAAEMIYRLIPEDGLNKRN